MLQLGMKSDAPKKIISKNRKVHFDYFVEDSLETGIALVGSEVKAIREGGVSLSESFVHINTEGRLTLVNAHINEYKQANINNHEVRRTRYLLAHKKEIKRLDSYITRKGYTLMALEAYFSGKNVKILIGLCKGKKLHDKREVQKEREVRMEISRTVKQYNSK